MSFGLLCIQGDKSQEKINIVTTQMESIMWTQTQKLRVSEVSTFIYVDVAIWTKKYFGVWA